MELIHTFELKLLRLVSSFLKRGNVIDGYECYEWMTDLGFDELESENFLFTNVKNKADGHWFCGRNGEYFSEGRLWNLFIYL